MVGEAIWSARHCCSNSESMRGQTGQVSGGAVELADLPVEAVGEEAVGQLKEEVASHRLLDAVQAHAVVEEAVEDGLADPAGVSGARLDTGDV